MIVKKSESQAAKQPLLIQPPGYNSVPVSGTSDGKINVVPYDETLREDGNSSRSVKGRLLLGECQGQLKAPRITPTGDIPVQVQNWPSNKVEATIKKPLDINPHPVDVRNWPAEVTVNEHLHACKVLPIYDEIELPGPILIKSIYLECRPKYFQCLIRVRGVTGWLSKIIIDLSQSYIKLDKLIIEADSQCSIGGYVIYYDS